MPWSKLCSNTIIFANLTPHDSARPGNLAPLSLQHTACLQSAQRVATTPVGFAGLIELAQTSTTNLFITRASAAAVSRLSSRGAKLASCIYLLDAASSSPSRCT